RLPGRRRRPRRTVPTAEAPHAGAVAAAHHAAAVATHHPGSRHAVPQHPLLVLLHPVGLRLREVAGLDGVVERLGVGLGERVGQRRLRHAQDRGRLRPDGGVETTRADRCRRLGGRGSDDHGAEHQEHAKPDEQNLETGAHRLYLLALLSHAPNLRPEPQAQVKTASGLAQDCVRMIAPAPPAASGKDPMRSPPTDLDYAPSGYVAEVTGMPPLSLDQQRTVEGIVSPARARFDERERRLYSHDTGVLPRLVRPLAGRSLADGVVQPETEQQVVELVDLARREGIPLVPRGRGTAGYGGAVPTHGGLVLDMTRYKGVVAVDAEALTATVRAGTVWNDLETELNAQGLALRLYPTSAPSSTVAGWLAQGGAGIGSHAFGWFAENVVGARVVGGDGMVHELRGGDLVGVADAEGTTGVVLEVTLRVRPSREQEQTAVAFKTAGQLNRAIEIIAETGAPVWSISFVNPTMARLKNAGPPKTHHGHPLPTGPKLPEDRYVALF